ncbi:MAG: tetratricopeptide repeat protein [Gammaproteobacteria bacterium]
MTDINALKNRVSALLKKNRQVEARDLLIKHIRKKQDNADLWCMLGTTNAQLEKYDEAEACYRRATEAKPDYFAAHCNLGLLYQRTNRLEKAEHAIRNALRIQPANVNALHSLVDILCARGKPDDAEASVRNYLARDPGNASALHMLAIVLQKQQRSDEALRVLDSASKAQPGNSALYFDKGLLLHMKGNLSDAANCYRNALKYQPAHINAMNNLGNILCSLGNHGEAIKYYTAAIALAPDNAALYSNVGAVFMETNQLVEAERSFVQALKYKGGSIEIYNNLGTIYKRIGRLSDAETVFRKALALKQDSVYSLNYLGIVLKEKGLVPGALKNFRKVLKIDPGDAVVHSNFLCCLNYCLNIDNKVLAREHRHWGELHGRLESTTVINWTNKPDADRPLRIGYVSPDFRDHPIGYFIEGILKYHNSKEVQTYCYSNVSREDSVTLRLKNLAAHWSSITKQSDATVVEQIRRDRIDILIDLAGHTGDNRLPVFVQKPAPIQVSYLGYPNTTGLTQMDYRLTDRWADPESEDEQYYTEKLIRLTPPFFCYRPPRDAPEITRLPAFTSGRVTFGSLNNLAKINKQVIRLWAHVLCEVEGSRLVLQSSAFDDQGIRQRFKQKFAQFGIEEERLILKKRIPFVEHLGVYSELDIALDPYPWNGHTTTCHSLWMGVPVITLAGKRHSGRLSKSVLFSLGLNDWVAQTEEQYVQLAVAWAGRLEQLNELRQVMRERMLASPLCDGSRLVKGLEKTYREVWRQWCRAPAAGQAGRSATTLNRKP